MTKKVRNQRFVSSKRNMKVLLSHTHLIVCCSLFWPKKVHFKTKIYLVLTHLCYLIFLFGYFMCRNFNFVHTYFAHESLKKIHSKVGCFIKIEYCWKLTYLVQMFVRNKRIIAQISYLSSLQKPRLLCEPFFLPACN